MKTNMKKRLLKIGLLFTVLAALIVGIALPVSATGPKATPNGLTFHIVQGKVETTNTSTQTFVVLTANQQQVTVTTNSSTQYFLIPMGKAIGYVANQVTKDTKEDRKEGIKNQNRAAQLKELHIPANWRSNLGWLATFDNPASFSDIAVGERVIVRTDNNNLAKQVLIIKAPVIKTVKGSVTLVDATHIKIAPATGTAVTVTIVDSTRIVLKGQTTFTGYGVAVYDSSKNNDAVTINIQPNAPAANTNQNSD
jgi:hypothetical protein